MKKRYNLLRAVLCVMLCVCLLAQTGLTAFAATAEENTAPTAPTGLLMELMEKPFGIDNPNPAMSWIVNDADNNEVQTAYQILVASSQEKIAADNGDVWDSGKVESNESSNALYAGPALAANTTYYWKVRTWDKADAVSPWSEAQRFSTAIDTWQGKALWVGNPGTTGGGATAADTVFERMGWKNYDIECKFAITSKAMGFCLYMDNSEKNCYMWQVREDTDKVIPHYFQDGQPHPANSAEAADVTFSIDPIEKGAENTMKLSVRGSVVTMTVNGKLVNTFDLAEYGYPVYNGGSFGFRTGGSESGWIDDLKVTNEAGIVVYQNDFSAACSDFGNATVSDGRLQIPNSGRSYYIVSDNIFTNSGWYDYDLECDFGVNEKALGISFYTDNAESNCYMWQVRGDRNVLCPHVFTNGKANVDTNDDGGSDVSLAAAGVTVAADNAAHKLKLSLRGSTVETYIDGKLVDTRTMGEYSYGSIGFRTGGTESGWVDNVKVTNKYGTVIYEEDFSSGKNEYSSGTISDGKFIINKGNKAYYSVVENEVGGDEEAPYVEPRGKVFFVRKDFATAEGKTVDSAVLSITAIRSGFKSSGSVTTRQWTYKAYVNGAFAGMGPHMDSNLGNYFYNTFDVTEQVVNGDNTVGAIVYALQDQRFQAQLKVTYTDGTSEIIASDESWMTLDGTAAYGEGEASIGTSYFTAMAENIDARVFPYGWNTPGYDASEWYAPTVKTQITNLTASPMDPMYENEVAIAEVIDKGNGNYFIDLGKEIIGGLRLTLNKEGVAGNDITVLYGEELNGTNSVMWQMRTGNKYREFWTLKNGEQTFEHFGMKNFRYVELQNVPASITKEDIENNLKGVAIHMAFDEEESYFVSNSELLNAIYEFCKYSLKVTTQDLYVDSQSRERGPYEGDAYVNQLSHYAFARNFTASRFTNEFMAYHPEWCTEYSMQNGMSFWQDYMHTGNPESITTHYDKIAADKVLASRYDETYKMINTNGKSDLVDWPASQRDGYLVDGNNYYNTVINAFNYQSALDVARMADLLGKTEDAEKFHALAANLKEGVMALYDEELGRFYEGRGADGAILTEADPAQHASFFPLAFGMIDDPEKAASVVAFLEQEGIQCSVYATQYLFNAMYGSGNGQGALDMLLSKKTESWYHLIFELGATIASEAWDPAQKSNMTFSHAWGSAPGNVIVRNLCGITPLEAGYSKAQIRPAIGDLETVSVKVPNIKGYICMDLDTTSPAYVTDMTVTLPANTTAKVYVPAGDYDGNSVVVDGETVTAQRDGLYLVVDNVGSGTHTFRVTTTLKLAASMEEGVNFTGDSKQITLSAFDANAETVSLEGAAVSYESTNEEVATVDANGLVTFVGAGSAYINVTVVFTNVEVNGGIIESLTLTQAVSVTADDPAVCGVKLEREGNQLTMYAVYDSGAKVAIDPSLVNFDSSRPDVATVNADGTINHVGEGDVYFIATTKALFGEKSDKLPYGIWVAEEVIFDDSFDNNKNFAGTTSSDGKLSVGKGKKVFYTGGTNWSDYMVTTTAKAVDRAWSVTFYQTDASNFYLWQINEAEGNTLKTHYFKPGAGTQGYVQTDTVKLGDYYKPGEYNTMRIVCVEGIIRTYVNNVLVHTIEDANLTMGSVGFRNGSSESNLYDRMIVSKPVMRDFVAATMPATEVDVLVEGETATTVNKGTVNYTVSFENGKDVATATLKMAVNNTELESWKLAEGWFSLVETYENGVLTMVICNEKGVATNDKTPIVELTLKADTVGKISVDVTKAVLAAYLGEGPDGGEKYVDVNLDKASCETEVDYNTFDVNRDGIVDMLDLTRAQRWFGTDDAICDVNDDGTVDVEDMILILNNYTVEI